MRQFSVLATVLAVGLAAAACDIKTSANGNFSFDIAAGKATDTVVADLQGPEKGRFELINVNGRITVEPTDGAEVVVEGRRTAKANSDEAAKETAGETRDSRGGRGIDGPCGIPAAASQRVLGS
jgi:hypothetical protein